MKNSKRMYTKAITLVLLIALVASTVFTTVIFAKSAHDDTVSSSYINLFKDDILFNHEQYFDSSVVYQLPESVDDDEEISIILMTEATSVLDAFDKNGAGLSLKEFRDSEEGQAIIAEADNKVNEMLSVIKSQGVEFELGEVYDTLFTGFEIIIKAGSLKNVYSAFDNDVDIMVGEVYEPAADDVVNIVDVYYTGIFNSEGVGYDGSGTVVAIIDTGYDYTHSVFSTENFSPSSLGLTFAEVESLVGSTQASTFHESLTANDVYINEKIPFAYDYSDKDTDVLGLNNQHGTHVAGIVAGKNNVITGVAPNAQLALMKVFSDNESGAKTSWLLAAVEDCVVLGVDVINMSLGASNGFSRDMDKELANEIYDSVRERGISLVVAAGNDSSAAQGSQKNGNLGLTSNPDVATVGSPSTYQSSLSVASIDGTDTYYLLYNGEIIYYSEASDRAGEDKHFVDDLLGQTTEGEFEYVLIPGVGNDADYTGINIQGKIALVARGDTTFEEKANTAQKMGAIGIIIYNNVSGEIRMSVGETSIAVCSVSKDDGEKLAAAGGGIIKVSRDQAAGPFMSSFSSWGPGPGLEIKPEITAHGGYIYSAIPGEDYDTLSGTSMASPNVAGLATLIRQYVIERFFADAKDANGNLSVADRVKVTAMVNRLMMSTADTVLNKNGLPDSVRKQGAGLANLKDILATDAYILTYNRADGSVMDKSKIELGDDPLKTGVYTLKFSIQNFGSSAVSYNMGSYVMTEGVAETLTNKGETTVTGMGYTLDGASVVISSITGGTNEGGNITVNAGATADITVTITLTDENKKYIDDSFENGMYVEGFLTFAANEGTATDLSVPYLAFYGDWTQAPIMDTDFFETNKDELDESIDLLDKTLPDAYASRPVGGLYDDYISYAGAYYYKQKPGTTLISADRKYIAFSNQKYGVNSLRSIYAGMLRNAERVEVVITDDVTGEVVFTTTEYGIRKSRSMGSGHAPASVDVEFSMLDHELANNSRYTVTAKAYLAYGDGGENTNVSNEFSFPFVTDFEAPTLTDVEFYTEYDKASKTNRLYAKMAIYDNHYAMSAMPGYITKDEKTNSYSASGFDSYFNQIYSEFNSTSYLVYELTDYIDDIKENAYNKNTFSVVLIDYALNQSVYEVALPDDIVDLYFEEEQITLSPNQLYDLKPIVYPGSEWIELIEYSSSNESVVKVAGTQIIAIGSGSATVTASVTLDGGVTKTADLDVTVLAEGDAGYKRYDKPVVSDFELIGYKTIKAFYFLSNDDREIGLDDSNTMYTDADYKLTLYPSESVRLLYELVDYFGNTEVRFQSSNENIVTVDEDGVVVGVAEGFASVNLKVYADGKSTYYSKTVSIEVKDPYVYQSGTLSHYYGLGGEVKIPESLKLKTIGDYAFSNYNYVPKDLSAGDVIDEENPYNTKIAYIGEDTITSIIIPEGVESIGNFAFAGLTSLEKVVLPSTLRTIAQGAFEGCTSLKSVELADGSKTINAKFINKKAFFNTNLEGSYQLPNAIGIAEYAFANDKKVDGVLKGNTTLTEIVLSESTRSIAAYAFAGNTALSKVTLNAPQVKLGEYAFENCSSLTAFSLNAAVIPLGAFSGCSSLADFTLGKDVAEINGLAFEGTKIAAFKLDPNNATFAVADGGKYLLSKDGTTILLGATTLDRLQVDGTTITAIGKGAFAGNKSLSIIKLPGVTRIGEYAFAECTMLSKLELGNLSYIGDYAFYGAAIKQISLEHATYIGDYSFAQSSISSISIPANVTVGKYAFYNCDSLITATIADGVILSDYAFAVDFSSKHYNVYSYAKNGKTIYYISLKASLKNLTIGNNVTVGDYAFQYNAALKNVSLGSGAKIGSYAFHNCVALETIDLSKAVSIGDFAFAGGIFNEFFLEDGEYVPGTEYHESGLFGQYLFRIYGSSLQSVDLSSATSIGKNAFQYAEKLNSVTLGASVTEIPEYAFAGCKQLATINLSGIQKIGEAAFDETALTVVDLSAAVEIGESAFADVITITKVTLGENIDTIGKSAFDGCSALATVNGLGNAKYIKARAFAGTALTTADITSVIELGSLAFAKDTATDFTVTFGDKIKVIGNTTLTSEDGKQNINARTGNPFAGCRIKALYTIIEEKFNNKVVSEIKSYTFDISETVKVINGSIYRVVPKTFDIGKSIEQGLELVTYCGDGGSVTVADYTVRIGDRAFYGTEVTDVLLPYTVSAIGDKAFFACDKLSLVTFTSYRAPIFEEAYDYDYYLDPDTLPGIPDEDIAYGLGILNFKAYTVGSASNSFYGANFINYVGQVDRKIVMVRPVNGINYDTYIASHYFATTINGATAAEDATLEAIAAINRIPEKVLLTDEAIVIAAREAYDRIATKAQQSLVENISILTAAEKRIIDLKYLASTPDEPPVDEPTDEPVDDSSKFPWVAVIIIAGSVIVLAAIAVVVIIILKKKNIALFSSKKEEQTAPVEEVAEVAEATEEAPVAEQTPAEETTPAEEAPAAEENGDSTEE